MKHMTYQIAAAVCAGFMLLAAPALALDLDEARSRGIVGEKLDGYVTVIHSSAEADKLAADVNARRLDEYTRIGKQNGQSPAVVGKLASPKIISGLPKGALYEGNNGAWITR